ncbi:MULTISPECIES: LPS translocon maturation chaperone LptM [Serratia]|nr:lipoprotein [Serratia rubidaea]MDK1705528.1 lipoprotein [Serratia rubidaea]
MKKQLRYALLAVLVAGLSGCGLKGPLYFPADEAKGEKAAQPVQTGDQVQKNQQEAAGSQQKPSMTAQ